MIIDTHVDIYDFIAYPHFLQMEDHDFSKKGKRSVDLPSLQENEVYTFFASVCPIDPSTFTYEKHPIEKDIEKTVDFLQQWGIKPFNGERGYVLHVEGLGWAKNVEDVIRLKKFHVRSVGPFWESSNVFGSEKGMSEAGYKLLREDFILDLAHAPEKVVEDVYNEGRPFVITHTGLKRFVNVKRNISDKVIRMTSDIGGFIGIFVDREWGGGTPYLLAKQYNHLKRIGGVEVTAIGTDFLGIPWNELGTIKRYEDLQRVFKWLKYMGWTSEEIESLKWENVLRVIR